MQSIIKGHIQRHIQVFEQVFQHLTSEVECCALQLCKALDKGNKILVMGNGGSAADAQHFAAELVGRFMRNRAALPAIALTTDTSILTAVANDFGYDQVFLRQVQALAQPGDVVVGISTSGNSPNVVNALKFARENQCLTVALSGRDGGEMASEADISLIVGVDETPRIQEVHLSVIHILCDLIEQRLFPV